MIYIFYDAFSYSRYILDEIRDMEEVTCVEVPFTRGISKIMHKWSKHLPKSLYTPVAHNKEVKAALNVMKPEDAVIIFDITNYVNVKYLLKHVKCETVHIWLWNTLNKNSSRLFTLSTDKKILFHTFDPHDAKTHTMHLHNQFYRDPKRQEGEESEIYDFFFVGMNKGRLNTLRELNRLLTGWGYTTKFIIVDRHTKNGVIDGIEFRNKDVDYDETLRLIRQSKVLVDCTKSKQTGLTLRALEGLFMNKKVLTNNPEITKLPFYEPSRFLLMDDMNSEKTLSDFMSIPVTPATAEEKEPYEVNHWLQEIISIK